MKKIIVSVVALLVAVGGGTFAFRYYAGQQKPVAPVVQMTRPIVQEGTMRPEPRFERPIEQRSVPITPSADTPQSATPAIVKKTLDDSVSTLDNPVKVPTTDGKTYFIVGQPKGQNTQHPRKIVFSLPGHGTTSEQGYTVWKPHIIGGDYALASVNWWDGDGEKITDYYRPDEVLREIRAFLDTYGYTAADFVVLEGFSRGSANTYPVKAYDMVSGTPVIDAVISASGKYQSDFPLTPDQSALKGTLYSGVPWILVCGEKDDNPERDGCIGMNETKTYLTSMGANVLKVLSDPKGGHGAFHQSPLKLPEQAFALLDALSATH